MALHRRTRDLKQPTFRLQYMNSTRTFPLFGHHWHILSHLKRSTSSCQKVHRKRKRGLLLYSHGRNAMYQGQHESSSKMNHYHHYRHQIYPLKRMRTQSETLARMSLGHRSIRQSSVMDQSAIFIEQWASTRMQPQARMRGMK